MRIIISIFIAVFIFLSSLNANESSENKAFVEANLYHLTGSLISTNIYLTYMSIDMLFINANNYTNEEKLVICNSIEEGLKNTKKEFSSINTIIDYEHKEKFKNYVIVLYNSLIDDLTLLKEYFKDNEDNSRQNFLDNHKKIWKLLSQNLENKQDEKDR